MPWLPPGTPDNILAMLTPERWASAMDGATLHGHGLHGPPNNTEVGIINKGFYFTSSFRKHDFDKGMCCQIIRSQNDANGVKKSLINIPGITEYRDTTRNQWHDNVWVPASYIDVKGPWEADINKFKTRVNLLTGKFEPSKWKGLPAGQTWDGSVLGKTIQKLITAMHTNPADFMTGKLDDLVKQTHGGVNGLAQIIIDGIKKAGMYDVLNKDFTATDLLNAATDIIDDTYPDRKGAGVYFRKHLTGTSSSYWKPNTTYGYVGKTVDFGARRRDHRYTTSKYGDLTRGSAQLSMFALCKLEPAAKTALYYLAEQIFTCLLETYRSVLDTRHSVAMELGTIDAFQKASYFKDVSKQVFEITRWPGGVSRSSFEIAEGANWSSPLTEWDFISEKTLYIRTDDKITDKKTLRSIDVATFRNAHPFTAMPDAKGRFEATHLQDKICMKLLAKGTRSTDIPGGGDPPVPITRNTKYHIVFEVYKDGTPHPEAWAQLPDVGRFKNWNQANSLAVRIEWQDPIDPGKWRFRYIKSSNLRLTDDQPGSYRSYGNVVAILPWLFGVNAKKPRYEWVPKLYGSARVMQAHYDLVQHTVTFGPQNKDFTMLSDLRLSNAEIKAQMEASPRLKNVGMDLAGFKASLSSGTMRTNCDLCLLLKSTALGPRMLSGGGCKPSGQSNRCICCKALGLPVCSWTPGLLSRSAYLTGKSGNAPGKVPAENLALYLEIRTALYSRSRIYPEGSFDAVTALFEDKDDLEEDDTNLGNSDFASTEPSVTVQDDDMDDDLDE